ncbi:hypothetical protein JB92DRAFT_3106466 [Gautieria morchelliformis]|nr:hypothetical protein JB92DRAFT_3106466 [Gautieria morchelliformis]
MADLGSQEEMTTPSLSLLPPQPTRGVLLAPIITSFSTLDPYLRGTQEQGGRPSEGCIPRPPTPHADRPTESTHTPPIAQLEDGRKDVVWNQGFIFVFGFLSPCLRCWLMYIRSMRFSPSRKLLVMGAKDKQIHMSGATCLAGRKEAHPQPYRVWSWDKTTHIWDIETRGSGDAVENVNMGVLATWTRSLLTRSSGI